MSIAGVLALPPTESCSSLFGGLESICCLVVQNVLHCATILNHNKLITTLSPQNLPFEAIVVVVVWKFFISALIIPRIVLHFWTAHSFIGTKFGTFPLPQ
jgi:hypothetical protein